jgi:hypothetical protein
MDRESREFIYQKLLADCQRYKQSRNGPIGKKLSERDICTKFITPALINAGWDHDRQIREEVNVTAGTRIAATRIRSLFRDQKTVPSTAGQHNPPCPQHNRIYLNAISHD